MLWPTGIFVARTWVSRTRTSLQSYHSGLHGPHSFACSRPQIPKLAMLSPEEVGTMGPFYDETRPCFQWSYHSPYLQVQEKKVCSINVASLISLLRVVGPPVIQHHLAARSSNGSSPLCHAVQTILRPNFLPGPPLSRSFSRSCSTGRARGPCRRKRASYQGGGMWFSSAAGRGERVAPNVYRVASMRLWWGDSGKTTRCLAVQGCPPFRIPGKL